MAIYHLTVKNGSKSKGHHAAEKQAYIERLGKYADRDDLVYSCSGNLPFFASTDQRAFWLAVDNYERDNATVYKEVEFSLPRELSTAEQIDLATSFVKHLTTQNNLPYTFAIHSGIDHETGEVNNPHCHLIFNERGTDELQRDAFTHFRRYNKKEPAKGGAKKLDLSKKDWLRQLRKDWQEFANDKLQQNKINERIDHRTLKAQGILREPQIHLGKTASYLLREKNIQNPRVDRYILIDRLNTEIGALEHELNREIKECQNDRRTSPGDQTLGIDLINSHRRIHEHQSSLERLLNASQEQQPAIGSQLPTKHPEHGSANQGNSQALGLAHQNQMDDHLTHPIDHLYSSHLHDVMEILSSRDNSSSPSLPSSNPRRWESVDTGQTSNQELDFKNDRTRQAIYKQIKAMGVDKVTITIQNKESKTQRDWTLNEVLENTSWLKKENAKGADILIAPQPYKNSNLILLKDLGKAHIENLNTLGYEPCIVTQTTPDQYEAWIKVSNTLIREDVKTEIAQTLYQKIQPQNDNHNDNLKSNTTEQSMSVHQQGHQSERRNEAKNEGRLAGFTNRQTEYKNEQGQSPFVKLNNVNQKVATSGAKLIEQIQDKLEQNKLQQEKEKRFKAILESSDYSFNAQDDYKTRAKELIEENGRSLDLKKLDQEVIKTMALTGKYSEKVLMATLEKCSPNIQSRDDKNIQFYAQQTVKDVMRLPEVVKAKELQNQQEKQKSQSRGMGL